MYKTNAIQLHFLVRLFWYLSQWSGLICSIFCTRPYSKDIHCGIHDKFKDFYCFHFVTMAHSKKANFNRSIIKKEHIPHLGPCNGKVCIHDKIEDFYDFHFVTMAHSKKSTFQNEYIPKTVLSTFRAIFQKGHISKGAYSKNRTFHI